MARGQVTGQFHGKMLQYKVTLLGVDLLQMLKILCSDKSFKVSLQSAQSQFFSLKTAKTRSTKKCTCYSGSFFGTKQKLHFKLEEMALKN